MILGLDLGTSTGFCYGVGDALPIVGSERMPSTGDEVGAFLDHFDRWLHVKLESLAPELVGFEAPLLPSSGQTTIMTTRKLQALAGVVEMACHRRGIDCQETYLQTVKKGLTGKGNATKEEMRAAARRYGLPISDGYEGYDESDAFGVWVIAIRTNRPNLAHRWDPLFAHGQ